MATKKEKSGITPEWAGNCPKCGLVFIYQNRKPKTCKQVVHGNVCRAHLNNVTLCPPHFPLGLSSEDITLPIPPNLPPPKPPLPPPHQ